MLKNQDTIEYYDNYLERKKRLTDADVVKIFPEITTILPDKINELRQEKQSLEAYVKQQQDIVFESTSDEFSQWFWCHWIDLTTGEVLVAVNKTIARLNRLHRAVKGIAAPKGAITDDLINHAREVPVESLFDQTFRRSGRGLVGLCPFHEEKTPSFHIYPEQNRAWCFGCNRGGGPIDVVMLQQEVDFKHAVLILTGDHP